MCTIFVQSEVPAHFVLNSLLEMITPLSWLERVPTYKDQQEQLREKDLATIGFLGYPVLQSADILVYQADFVPVGQDQAAHVEITREIARRFNHLYGEQAPELATRPRQSDKERLAELEQDDGCARDSAGAEGAADAEPEAAGDRWAEDVEELWQHDSAERSRGGDSREAEDDGDRPGAGAADRPGESGGVPGVRSAQGVFDRRRCRRRRRRAAGRRGLAASSARAGWRMRWWRSLRRSRSGGGTSRRIRTRWMRFWTRARCARMARTAVTMRQVFAAVGLCRAMRRTR